MFSVYNPALGLWILHLLTVGSRTPTIFLNAFELNTTMRPFLWWQEVPTLTFVGLFLFVLIETGSLNVALTGFNS